MFDDRADQVLGELRRMLCLRGRSSVTRIDAEVWEEVLIRQGIHWGEFQAAVDHWIDSQQFFPSPSDIVLGVTKVRVAMRASKDVEKRDQARAEWDRKEAEDAMDPRFGQVLKDGQSDPDWVEDGGPPMWLRKLAHENGLCTWRIAHDPARVCAEVALVQLYAAAHPGEIS